MVQPGVLPPGKPLKPSSNFRLWSTIDALFYKGVCGQPNQTCGGILAKCGGALAAVLLVYQQAFADSWRTRCDVETMLVDVRMDVH